MTFQDWTPIIGMATIVFIFWRQGGNTASSQVITAYKERVEQLQVQVNELTKKLGELTGQLKEKDDRVRTLESIATNRNPELQTFMTYVTETMKQSTAITTEAQQYMKNSTDYLHTIKNQLTTIALQSSFNRKKVGEK